MNRTLEAIDKNGMIFISAQPDEIYFHWQVELYLYQFSKHGIIDKCYAIFCYKENGPSDKVKTLMKQYKNIFCYKDERKYVPKYVPLVRPYILNKFFKDYPELGRNVFYHDSDIFIVKLPKFEWMLGDNIGYLSDTVNYIGYNYLKNCSSRYKEKHPTLPEEDLFIKMCDVMKISPDLVKHNEANSGGAQYLLKNIDADFWANVEKSSEELYNFLKTYETQYPIAHHIQSWATDMWGVLWEYWKMGRPTKVHNELKFSWATDNVHTYYERNIFHLAGIKANMGGDKFYKGKYKTKNAIDEYMADSKIFEHISSNNATYEYVYVLKKYVETLKIKEPDRFSLEISHPWKGIYRKQATVMFGKPIWKSINDRFIIFHNTSLWILTSTRYIEELSTNSGGFASNSGTNPYDDNWNVSGCKITLL
jgi:hypothetical protein